ncbi:transporter substrate-binding protein [Methylosinus trichosporium]|nr:transporter substrate-binding protein [Methylosinus trichosporium]
MAQSFRAKLPSPMPTTAALLATSTPILVGVTTGSPALACASALVAALAAAAYIERRLSPHMEAMERIAGGDRYAALPGASDRLSARLRDVAERMRDALVSADAVAGAQRSREAELEIRNAGQAFFAGRFRERAEAAVSAFDAASAAIRASADDLHACNAEARRRAAAASAAARAAASDMDSLAGAARAAIDLLAGSARQVAEARGAADRTARELARADRTVRSLAEAAGHIGEVSRLIQAIAAQTSMLALNATIEAARAGESGRGFAVVAGEVKTLSNQAAAAASDIEAQISAIRRVVEETVGAIAAVSSSVEDMARLDLGLADTLDREAGELDRIGARAALVAHEVSAALPDMSGVVAEVDSAGRATLTMAESLLDRSTVLAEAVGRFFRDMNGGAIRVGVLHSLSGTMTSSERPLQELLVMLIEQRNANGGLLGRPIEAVIMDPRSVPSLYAEQARALLEDRKVDAIFGCWTSASRKETLPVLERLGGLLFYPSQYEGEERSPNIVYAGGTPSQTAIPAIDFLRTRGARRFVLVGGDDVYPRVTHAILRAYLSARGIGGGDVLERYAPRGREDWDAIGEEIRGFCARPGAAIVSTVSGDANLRFFSELARRGRGRATTPILSLSIGEAELPALAHCGVDGVHVAWNYLHAIDGEANRRFIDDWRRFKSAPDAMTNDAMEATWLGFNLWSAAVAAAGSSQAEKVRATLGGLRLEAPSGFTVRVDEETHHLFKPAFVGRIDQGRILPVWTSAGLIAPEPWSPWLAQRGNAPGARRAVAS